MDSIKHYIEQEYQHANDIARAVGIEYPGNNDSPGAMWLMSIRDAFIEDADRITVAEYPEDEADESADSSVEGHSTYLQWQIWTDLQLWRFDSDLQAGRATLWGDIGGLAADVLSEVAGNVYRLLLQDVQAASEAEPDSADESQAGL